MEKLLTIETDAVSLENEAEGSDTGRDTGGAAPEAACASQPEDSSSADEQSLRSRAEEAEKKAAGLPPDEAEQASKLYAEAARLWRDLYDRRGCRDAFLASKMLFCLRRAGEDASDLLPLARELVARHPDSRFLRSHLGWICYRAMKDAVAFGDSEWVLELAAEAVAQVPFLPEPAKLCNSVLYGLRMLMKQADGVPQERMARAGEIANLLREIGEPLSKGLSTDADEGAQCSPLELFYYLVRRVGREAGDWDLIESYVGKAVERFPRNEWFAQLDVECAIRAGDLDEAIRRAERHSRRLAGSIAVAEAHAEALERAGRPDDAVLLLWEACERKGKPWNWHRLAELCERAGRLEDAERACTLGLSRHKPRDAGRVWKLHFDRARLLLASGRVEQAAREAWLSLEARRVSGWSPNPQQRIFCEQNAGIFSPVFERLDAEPEGAVRKKALAEYVALRNGGRGGDGKRVAGKLRWFDEQRGFGFVDTADGRQVFLHRSVVGDRKFESGQKVIVEVAEAFDRKKGKPGWKATAIEPDDGTNCGAGRTGEHTG